MNPLFKNKQQPWEELRKQGKAMFIVKYTVINTIITCLVWLIIDPMFNFIFDKKPLFSAHGLIPFSIVMGLISWYNGTSKWNSNESNLSSPSEPAP